jgi:hypothetical protein
LPKLFGFSSPEMLEVRVNQAHLLNLPIGVPDLFNPRGFVRELFTIHSFTAFAEVRDLRPVRSIGAE